jgi:hypothetical protein
MNGLTFDERQKKFDERKVFIDICIKFKLAQLQTRGSLELMLIYE